jgi:hypothetical protein
MLKKVLLQLAIGSCLAFSAMAQGVVVQVAPPRPVVETRGPAPGAGYVWVGGYHQWNGSAYVWVPGRWDRPPHPGAHWVAHRWVHRHDGWVLNEGHWR